MKKVPLDLANIDGNVYVIVGKFRRAARRFGWTPDEIEAVTKDAMSGDYDHLLRTIIGHTEPPEDDAE